MKKSFFIGEFAKVSGVSIQTLHHYDKLGLLKPKIRTDSKYRIYDHQSLILLMRIQAFKNFGFNLGQIKKLLSESSNLIEELLLQGKILRERGTMALKMADLIEQIIAESGSTGSVSTTNLVKLLESYNMMEQLQKSWAAKFFNSAQLKLFALAFAPLTKEEVVKYSEDWTAIVQEVRVAVKDKQDPCGQVGQALAKKWMTLLSKHSDGNPEWRKIGEIAWNAYKNDSFPEEAYRVPNDGEVKITYTKMPKEVVIWIDQAIIHMYKSGKI